MTDENQSFSGLELTAKEKKCGCSDCIIMPATLPKTPETGHNAIEGMFMVLGGKPDATDEEAAALVQEVYDNTPHIASIYMNTVRMYYDPEYPGYNADPDARLSDLWLTDFLHFASLAPKIRNAPPEAVKELKWITERVATVKSSLN